MLSADALITRGFVAAMATLARYHRFEIIGLESLLAPGAKLIVGYHGRPLAIDLCMLTAVLQRRLGYLPHGIIHGYFGHDRALRRLIDGLGFLIGDGPELFAAVARGEHIVVAPGGTREGCRSVGDRYRVDWGGRLGYLRLALRYRLPIVPVATAGIDDVYLGLNDGYALGQRLGLPHRLPLWLGVGLFGVWPLAAPLPVKLTQRIGRPITAHLTSELQAESDEQALRAMDHTVRSAVQALLDEGRGLSQPERNER